MGARSVVYQLLTSPALTSPHYHLIISFLPHQTGGGVNVPDVLADLEVAGVKPGVMVGAQLAQRGTEGVESPGIQHCEMWLMRLLCPTLSRDTCLPGGGPPATDRAPPPEPESGSCESSLSRSPSSLHIVEVPHRSPSSLHIGLRGSEGPPTPDTSPAHIRYVTPLTL